MELKLGINNSMPAVAYKNVTSWHTYATNHFRLKDPVDVLEPVILVSKTAIPDNWKQFNYARIDTFNRYYFASFVCENAGMLEYKLSVDALSTYIDSILKQSFEIERAANSNKGNSQLYADQERPLQINKQIDHKRLLILPQHSGGGYYMTVSGG